jgi:hypothetical protein
MKVSRAPTYSVYEKRLHDAAQLTVTDTRRVRLVAERASVWRLQIQVRSSRRKLQFFFRG